MGETLFYDRKLETLDRAGLAELQNVRLRALIAELGRNMFYQQKARDAGLSLDEIKSLQDLRALPLTTKSELVAEQESHPPFGRMMYCAPDKYRYYHQTSGTTGRMLRWLDTEESWKWFTRCWGYVYRGAGVTSEDVVFCAFSFGPYVSHWTAIHGVWHTGALAISGGGMNSRQRLEAIIENRATVIVCTPTYALHLAEVARDAGIDLRSSTVRKGIHAGEPGASLPNVKRAIESAWDMTCFDHAGATEVGAWAFDCEAQNGAIHLNEAEFIFEVIDPESRNPVEEGERGELVVTNLGRVASPVLRYRTGDLVEMTTDACACGRTFARIRGGVLGRADDMMIVRGVNIYPSAVDDLLRGLPDVVEYEVSIMQVAGMDDLIIKIEAADASGFDKLQRAVLDLFRRKFNIRVGVEQAPRGSLPRYEFKARRFKRLT
jgi:phenylacetate-CoA ligase